SRYSRLKEVSDADAASIQLDQVMILETEITVLIEKVTKFRPNEKMGTIDFDLMNFMLQNVTEFYKIYPRVERVSATLDAVIQATNEIKTETARVTELKKRYLRMQAKVGKQMEDMHAAFPNVRTILN